MRDVIRKKRILLIATNDLAKSGVPEVIMQIVRLLHNTFIFDILITRNNTYHKKEFESYGGHVYALFEKEYKTRLLRFFYSVFILKRQISKKIKSLRNNNYTAIHSFKDMEGGYYLKCAKKNGIRIRISHCSRQHEKPIRLISKIKDAILLKRIFRYSTQLVAISSVAGKSLFGKKQFEILYNTYNENYYKFDCNGPSERLTLLQIGTYSPLKNQAFSVEVARIIKKTNLLFKLYFIGRVLDNDYYNSVTRLIEKYDLDNNVEMLPFDEDQNKIYSKTTFSIVPSLREGLSLAAIESQAKGITCFASTGVPNEVDCGNIVFLDLDPDLWANEIINRFKKTKGKRVKADLEKFSNKCFKTKLLDIYSKAN